MTQFDVAAIQATTDIVDGNLRCTAAGYWAEYRIEALSYGERSYDEKRAVGAAHKQLFSKLMPYNPLLGGFLKPETEAEITAKSLAIGGHDGQQPVDHNDGTIRAYAEMTADRVIDLALNPASWPRSRTLLVAFPVGKSRAAARRKRAKILAQLPKSWVITPAEPHDMAWLWTASIHRGVQFMPSIAEAGRVVDFTPAYFDDGAKEDTIDGYTPNKRPAVIKITPNGARCPVYQIVLKAVFPIGQMAFPGGTELFTVLNRTSLHVDWAIRCSHIPHAKVVSDNAEVRKTLESNKFETALEPARLDDDAIAEALLDDYDAKTAVNKKGDSVWFTILIAIGGPTLEAAEEIEAILSEVFAHLEVNFERIAGLQQELWSAMLPGNPASPEIHALGDEIDIAGFSEMVPFTDSRIGSPTGPIFGQNIKSGLWDLFRINTRAILAANLPSNAVLVGGLGAGKTTLLKWGMLYDGALGHLFAGYDRSEQGELVKIAKLVPGHIILDILAPDYSIDSLKTFKHDPALAGRHTLNTYINLLKFESGSDEELALSEALTKDNITANNITSAKRLQHVLLNSDDPIDQRVGRHLRKWANYDFARALFDDTLPPVDYAAPAFIIQTYGMPAAEASELYNEHLYKRLSPEKLYMEAVYELTGYALRTVYFARQEQICSIYLPEAWHLAHKPVGQEMISILGHDSRKAGCMLWMDTHLGKEDFMPGQTSLIGIRFVGHTESEAALDNLEWAGLHPENNPEFLTDITTNFRTGQFLVRFFDQVGAIQTFLPTDAAAAEAMNTTFRAGVMA
ncbi:hypothetical protein BKN37_18455 [Mycobacterium talmoniae]|uniref:Uncharacterized protein n=2 Tax=Mycobacterium talmoniae TaxID=1858794 RepID=A0A1S1NED4_9MYCO|nr:hypothetical protein BKN37_18455 [Mycobacterium talmoniae]